MANESIPPDGLNLAMPARSILEFEPTTLHLTKQNFNSILFTLPAELILIICTHIPHETDKKMARRVLNVQEKHSSLLECLLICRTFYRISHECVYQHTNFIVRSYHGPHWRRCLLPPNYINKLEVYTPLTSPGFRNSLTKITFAAAYSRNTIYDDCFDDNPAFKLFLPCIKWLPNLRHVTLVNITRHVWSDPNYGEFFMEEYDDLNAGVKAILGKASLPIRFRFIGDHTYTLSWPGQPEERRQQKITITPGIFARNGAATYLFRGLERDFIEFPYNDPADNLPLYDEELYRLAEAQWKYEEQQMLQQDAFVEVIGTLPSMSIEDDEQPLYYG